MMQPFLTIRSGSPSFVRLNRSLWPTLAKRARHIVTVSHFSKGRISEVLNIPENKITVIWNGVGESFKPSSRAAIEIATASVGIANRPYFATLSTIEPRKNLKLVLQAWTKAKPYLPLDMALLVIGGNGAKAVFGRPRTDDFTTSEGVVFSGYVGRKCCRPCYRAPKEFFTQASMKVLGCPCWKRWLAVSPQ